MSINALGYMEIKTNRLDEWVDFAPRILGLQLVEKSSQGLMFRMDDRKQRLIVSDGLEETSAVFGWEVDDSSALDALASRLEAISIRVKQLSTSQCQYRHFSSAIAFQDPAGNELVAYCGAEEASDAFEPGRPMLGFRTGPLGMGHAVLHVKSINDLMWFYTDVLGFKLTDYVPDPYQVFFFHVNERHHSLAMVESGKTGIHHIMLETLGLDDVGQGYDIVQQEDLVAMTLGRHTNDFMTSYYVHTPSGFMIEYGWGGRTIEPQSWEPKRVEHGSSFWGHDRTWMSPEELLEMRRIRAGAVAQGLRAPVQVMEGNFEIGAGRCAWLDGFKKGEAVNQIV